ncbi:hypothetical protein BDZ91DRAFT_405245 [Kalaharituber pfeilii]|nr:hypothetical protein BDZ91DRAFT_405245 [Kalaharituber pfeilii]
MTGQAKGDYAYSIGSPRMVLVGRFSYNTQRRTGCCHLRVSCPTAQPPQVGLVHFFIILQGSWPNLVRHSPPRTKLVQPWRGNLQAHGQWFKRFPHIFHPRVCCRDIRLQPPSVR